MVVNFDVKILQIEKIGSPNFAMEEA